MNRKNRGLTLIEVLVVVAITSILAVSLYVVFKSGMDAWSGSEGRLDVFQNARVALDQISRELPGAFVGGGAKFNLTAGAAAGDPDTLEFVTEFGDDIYEIKYELITGSILQRKYSRNPDDYSVPNYEDFANDDTDVVELSPYVTDIQFSHWDTGIPDWSDTATSWSDENVLPKAIKVEITLRQNPKDKTADVKVRSFETVIYLPNSK